AVDDHYAGAHRPWSHPFFVPAGLDAREIASRFRLVQHAEGCCSSIGTTWIIISSAAKDSCMPKRPFSKEEQRGSRAIMAWCAAAIGVLFACLLLLSYLGVIAP